MIWLLLACLSAPERLAEAVLCYQHRDFSRCLALAEPFSADDSLLGQAGQLLAGQCAFYLGDLHQAEHFFRRLADRYPRGPFRRLALLRAEDCRAEGEVSKEAWQEAQRGPADLISDPAPTLWRALSPKGLFPATLELLKVAPRHPLAMQALEELSLNELDPAQLLRLGRILKNQRYWNWANKIFTLALEKGSDQLRGQILLERGMTHFEAKNYQAAFEDLDRARSSLSGTDKLRAWLYRSRALGRSDDEEGAIRGHLELADAFPTSAFAPEALYYAGWLSMNRGKYAEAEKIFERVLQQYPNAPHAEEAGWFAAWCHIIVGDWPGALKKLNLASARTPSTKSRRLYWLARTLGQLGKNKQWQRTLSRLCSHDPFGWYSQLARLRFGEALCPLPEKPSFDPPDISKNPVLGTILTLHKTGLESWARQALHHYQNDSNSQPGALSKQTLALAWFTLGDCHRGWQIAHTLVSGGRWKNSNFTHPDCYDELVTRESGNDPLFKAFMMAVMRTESGFCPEAHSWADARGLMQLIPAIAEKAATALREEFSAENLFQPELNVHLAAQVIRTLAERFQNRWWLMAAAYNSSPEKVEEWLAQPAPVDLWVEQIPWQETREYVKSVLSAMAVYLWRYGSAVQPLAGTPLE